MGLPQDQSVLQAVIFMLPLLVYSFIALTDEHRYTCQLLKPLCRQATVHNQTAFVQGPLVVHTHPLAHWLE